MLDHQTQTKDDLKQRILRGVIVAITIAIGLITSYSAYYFVNAWTTDCPTECTQATVGQKYRGTYGFCWRTCSIDR